MVLIAGSAGAALYFGFGFRAAEALIIAIAVLTALGLYNSVTTGIGMRSVLHAQLRDLGRGNADMARQVAEIGRRLADLEGRVDTALDRTRAATDPLAVEIGELGTIVKQLAETAAEHEAALNELAKPETPGRAAPQTRAMPESVRRAVPEPARRDISAARRVVTESIGDAFVEPAAPVVATPPQVEAPPPPEPPPAPVQAPAAQAPAAAQMPAVAAEGTAPQPAAPAVAAPAVVEPTADQAAAMLSTIRVAVEANRIDLYLQPIVTLPQRKVRYYEAMTRLRTPVGEVLQAADFIAQAEAAGLMPKIDNLVVFRCVQVIRRLLLKNREIGLFCNLSGSTLNDAQVFPQLLEFLDANRAIASSIVLEFTQSALRSAGAIETESLAALAERGFRFSLDNVTDLRIEPRELATRGFRFMKIPANLLLNRGNAVTTDIHPADLSDLLGRFGIDLVAEKIESEGAVVDLLDYDVRFGQGFLFSPPRPVRAEALQGITERSDVVARESSSRENLGRENSGEGSGTGGMKLATNEPGDVKRTTGLAQLARRI
jgi:cyclic-di-GMP phosphodiesterase TipF (flagellum assembly factor)